MGVTPFENLFLNQKLYITERINVLALRRSHRLLGTSPAGGPAWAQRRCWARERSAGGCGSVRRRGGGDGAGAGPSPPPALTRSAVAVPGEEEERRGGEEGRGGERDVRE